MASKNLDEKQYFTLLAGIAILHDCKLLSINLPERIIDIAGRPEAVQNCSAELEDLLGRYTAE